jgi:hypothetical protein
MNDTETTETTTPTAARKWAADTANPPGKIQVNRVNQALRDLRSEHHTSIRKTGIIGKTEGYDAESEFRTVQFSIGGENAERADVRAVQDQIGEKYGYAVSRDNAKEIVADIEAALVTLAAARPVSDERQTQEQADTARAERIKDGEESRAKEEQRAQALRDTMAAAFGIPGRTVHLSPGEMAVVAVLCYDNSHYQSDYYDTHARLGVPLLVGTSRSSREDEATARRAMERFPSLAALRWEWKTEKYSMGHGNYLTSEAVDVPAALAATRQAYGGGEITKGHWEIKFQRGGRAEEEAFSVFAGYFDTPDPQASSEADAAAESRGALGTVRKNNEHNGVEISFPSKPSSGVLDALKREGFHWSRFSKVWYKKYSAAAWKAACDICGIVTAAPAEQDDGAGAYVQAQEEAFCDRQAEAIGA